MHVKTSCKHKRHFIYVPFLPGLISHLLPTTLHRWWLTRYCPKPDPAAPSWTPPSHGSASNSCAMLLYTRHPVLGRWEVELRLGKSEIRPPEARPLNTGVKCSNTFLGLAKISLNKACQPTAKQTPLSSSASVHPYKLIFTSLLTLLFCSYVHRKKRKVKNRSNFVFSPPFKWTELNVNSLCDLETKNNPKAAFKIPNHSTWADTSYKGEFSNLLWGKGRRRQDYS